MIVYDMARKVLYTESFGLISGITFVLFSQEKPLRWKEGNIHTHTQTHTRMYYFTEKIESYEKANFSEMSEAQSFHKTSSWMLLN